MEQDLEKAYGDNFKKGEPTEFARLVGERDKNVGLHVTFPTLTENKIIYQFHTDPFPNLKMEVSADKLDNTFIGFKVRHLLGDNWSYKNSAHIWRGDNYTEFTIFKSGVAK